MSGSTGTERGRCLLAAYGAGWEAVAALGHLLLPFRGASGSKLAGKLARLPPAQAPADCWVHACSVGEVAVALRCMDAIRRWGPGTRFVLTTVTREGHDLARQRVHPPDRVEWFPFDAPSCISRSFDAFAPKFVILCEVELWPNHLREARRRGIPVFVVNGRLTPRDERNYRRAGCLMRSAFAVPALVCARSAEDAARFHRLGARQVMVTGDMKFDPLPADDHGVQTLPDFAREGRPILLGASTHDGEESLLMEAFLELRGQLPALALVLVPRHPKRAAALRREAAARGLTAGRDLIVVDEVGRLTSLYAAATVAFIGKSLSAHGGQNFLEAVQAGCPVVFGPHMENFHEAARRFSRAGAALQVEKAADLTHALRHLLENPAMRQEQRARACALLEDQTGATAAAVDAIMTHLAGEHRGTASFTA